MAAGRSNDVMNVKGQPYWIHHLGFLGFLKKANKKSLDIELVKEVKLFNGTKSIEKWTNAC